MSPFHSKKLIYCIAVVSITILSPKSTNSNKLTGNLILGKFDPGDYKLNTIGEVIKKDTNEVITKRNYNSKTYQNLDQSYTAVSI